MVIFESEKDLLSKLAEYEQLINDCANEVVSFWEFVEKYNNFYHYYALDGHESDDEEFELLLKHEKRLLIHEQVTEQILNYVCSDDDANKPIYVNNGRFGSEVALRKLKSLTEIGATNA